MKREKKNSTWKWPKTWNNDALSYLFSSGLRRVWNLSNYYFHCSCVFIYLMSSCCMALCSVFLSSCQGGRLPVSFVFILLHFVENWKKCKWNEMISVFTIKLQTAIALCLFMLIIYKDSLSSEYFCDQITSCERIYVWNSLSRSFQCWLLPLFFYFNCALASSYCLAGDASSAKQRHCRFSIFLLFSTLIFSSPFKICFMPSFAAVILVTCSKDDCHAFKTAVDFKLSSSLTTNVYVVGGWHRTFLRFFLKSVNLKHFYKENRNLYWHEQKGHREREREKERGQDRREL